LSDTGQHHVGQSLGCHWFLALVHDERQIGVLAHEDKAVVPSNLESIDVPIAQWCR
jgi:hypothetical protein